MAGKLGRGWLGSLRRQVDHDVRQHLRENPAVRAARYPISTRIVRAVLANRTFQGLLATYALVAFGLFVVEAMLEPSWLPAWTKDAQKGFLKDAAGSLIAVQTGILGVLSVAVALVTLIAQRDDRSSTNTDIRLYYSEAMVYEVAASSVALLLVLCVQYFWPLQFGLHYFGLGSGNLFFKSAMTGLHVAWLALNITAFWQFVSTTLRFVEPKARGRMREQYMANIVIPAEVHDRMLRTLQVNSAKFLLPDDDQNLHFSMGFGMDDTGVVEVKKSFARPMVLRDIRFGPIGFALRRWWRRSSRPRRSKLTHGPRATTLASSVFLLIPPSFGQTFDGEAVLCRRQGGAALRVWERWLLGFGLRFGRQRKAFTDDLPPPSAVLEELADKVIGQTELLAETGFRAALEEMLSFHSFLIAAYGSRGENGVAFSLAEFGGLFENPHQAWLRQYRRVFARAVDKLSEDQQFVERLANVPYRLLVSTGGDVSREVENGLLDLGATLVVMLENWVTRRTSVANAPDAEAQPRIALAGSDRRAYEKVLRNFAGSWETVVRIRGPHYLAKGLVTSSPPSQWKLRTRSWSFLRHHLRNTAYFLALAVWNEDAIGSERFRDVLLRWLDSLQSDIRTDHFLRRQVLLTPQVFELEWADVETRLAPFARDRIGRIAPEFLFGSVVRWAYEDHVLVAAAVMLAWYINDQQASDAGGEAARLLVAREVIPGDGAQRSAHLGPPPGVFDRVMAVVIRAELSEQFQEGNYRGGLDSLVALLDGMSDRRAVPGRVYSTWGRDDLTTLTVPLLALMLAHMPNESDAVVLRRIDELTASEDAFGDGDASLRRIVAAFDDLKRVLIDASILTLLERGARKLAPELDVPVALARLTNLLSAMIDAIQVQRTGRLQAHPIDQTRLEPYRVALEGAMGDLAETPPFALAKLRHGALHGGALQEWRCYLDKAQLTVPPLDTPRDDLPSDVAGWFKEEALVPRIWASFGQRPKEVVLIANADRPEALWGVIIEKAQVFRGPAVLLVGYDPIGNDVVTWMHAPPEQVPLGIQVEQLPNRHVGGDTGYLATVNGVDVHVISDMPGDRAILFSKQTLRAIEHRKIDSKGRIAAIEFVQGADPRRSELCVRFDQTLEWDESPLIEFTLDSQQVAGGPEGAPVTDPAN